MGFKPEVINAAANLAIKKLFDNGVIGGEIKAVLTYDGTASEKVEMDEGVTYAKISDEPLDFATVTRIELRNANGVLKVCEKENLAFEEADGMGLIMDESVGALALSFSQDIADLGVTKGLYVVDTAMSGVHGWVSSVEYTKAVSTIDPKYLPGLTLPVVELSEATATALLGAGSATLTAEEAAKFDAMVSNCTPFILSIKMQGIVMASVLCQYIFDTSEYKQCYVGDFTGFTLDPEEAISGVKITVCKFTKNSDRWDAAYSYGYASH